MLGLRFPLGRRVGLLAALLLACILAGCTAAPAVPAATATAVPVPQPTVVPCDVPDLQFETEDFAMETLATRGMEAEVEYVATSDIPAGLVADQSVKAGDCPVDGAPVKLLVSVPTPTPAPTPTPTPAPAKKPSSKPAASETQETVQPAAAAPVNPDYPQVTPQPTWNIDFSLFDKSKEEPASSCGG